MGIDYEAGIKNIGDTDRFVKVFERAEKGEKLTIAFLGGSITQGSLASSPELCYAAQVFDWWRRTFPNAEFTYINAGIGATDSQFGCARAAEDVLAYKPDVISVEYAVNDSDNEHYLETFEGVVRKLLSADNAPAVYTFYNVCYDTGVNAEAQHSKVAEHYGLPAFSIKSTIYPLLVNGELTNRDITPDDLHPNDKGHKMVASVITYGLEKLFTKKTAQVTDSGDEKDKTASVCKLPTAITANAYEDSVRYRNRNAEIVTNNGWTADATEQNVITDIFKNGWTATEKGAKISFRVSGSCIGVQYRRTIQLPAPVAVARVDGEVKAVLDGNFDETWGDKLCLDTLLDHGKAGEHIVEIEITETHENDRLPMYIVSVIASGNGAEGQCSDNNSSDITENSEKYDEPLFLNPVLTHNIWGGTRLREDYGYKAEGNDIGECWGISAHPNGEGTIRGGYFDGTKLSELWDTHPELFGNTDAEGKRVLPYDRFPLLTKIIDAKDDLSIQVHPNDEYAALHENGSFGKTECWYVLDCEEGSSLVIGHNAGTREELVDMIDNGRWSDFIRELPVKKGDFLQIDPGTVHAIKGGVLILETQQNSDITYRVYDYDRLQNGKPRQLHVEQSKEVITVPAKSAEDSVRHMADIEENKPTVMCSCQYYTVSKINVNGLADYEMGSPFLCVSILEGSGTVNSFAVKKGDHLIIPGTASRAVFEGKMEVIVSTV